MRRIGWGIACLYSFWIYAASAAQVQVTLEGVTGQLRTNIRHFLTIDKEQKKTDLSPTRIERLHKQATEEIQRALQPLGYYQVTVQARLIPPEPPAVTWQAKYVVLAGEAITITDLTLAIVGEGEQDLSFRRIRRGFPVKQGQPLNHAQYEKAKQQLRQLAEERGYFDAQFIENKVEVDKKSYTARVVLRFDTGRRYCFGDVSFEQNGFKFSEEFLRDFIPFSPQQPYEGKVLRDFRIGLGEGDYFRTIELLHQMPEDRTTGCVSIVARLEPNRPNIYQLRLGYGTDTQLRTRGTWTRRYLNTAGHRSEVQAGLVQNRNRLIGKAEYIIPIEQVEHNLFKMGVDYEGEDFSAADIGFNLDSDTQDKTRVQDMGVSFSWEYPRYRGESGYLTETLSLRYLNESYDLLPLLFSPNLRDLVREALDADQQMLLEPRYSLIMPAIQWVYLNTDDRRYATNGYRLQLGILGSHKALGSTETFWQVMLQALWIRQLHAHGRLLSRLQLAYSDAKTVNILDIMQGNLLPKALQFKTGGDRSIRGYGFETLDGGNDNLVGGKHLAVGSVEYEHRILEAWSAAIFYDIGNVFNDFNNLEWKAGAGLGVRWHSPVGLVRVDIAKALEDEGSIRLHLTIGQDF